MDTFNRLIAILLWLLLLIVGLYTAIAPFTALEQVQSLSTWIEGLLTALQMENPANFVLGRAAWAVGAVLIFGTLIGMELLSRSRRTVRIRTADGGMANIETDSVGQRLTWNLDQLAEDVSVVPSVRSRGGSVDISLEVETAPDIDVPMKTDEVVDVTRDIVEQDMGLRLGKLDVHMRYAPYDPEWG